VITLKQFIVGKWNLAVYQNDKPAYQSEATNLEALTDYLRREGRRRRDVVMFDRYVGRASALLMTLCRPTKVYAGVISDGGAEIFEQSNIPFEAGETVNWLTGRASADMCRFEKLAQGRTAEELWCILNKHGNIAKAPG